MFKRKYKVFGTKLYDKYTCTCHITKLNKLQKYIFHHYKAWERKLASECFFEKVRASKWKLEVDDPKPPKERKISSHYEEGEAPVELVSTVEEHYHQIFISAEILHWNSLGNGNTAFKSVVWRRFGHEL